MSATEEELAQLEASVAEQGAKVRTLKKEKAAKEVIAEAVAELKKRKAVSPPLEVSAESRLTPQPRDQTLEDAKPKPWDRAPFEDLMRRRFIYAPAFEVYGGVAGFYDYGPVGCAIKVGPSFPKTKFQRKHEGIASFVCLRITVV